MCIFVMVLVNNIHDCWMYDGNDDDDDNNDNNTKISDLLNAPSSSST